MAIRINPDSFWPIIFMSVVVLLPTLLVMAFSDHSTSNIETLLFQMIMPGLNEELVFRGIFQSLLNRAFGKPSVLWGAQVGFGLVLTSLLFGVVHFVSIDKVGIVHFGDVLNLLRITGVGFAFGWIRERSGSLLPCVVLHGLLNIILPLV
jgi:membrane protease YdiL (CAAX protease family)